MSHKTYNLLWEEAQNILEGAINLDNIQLNTKACKDRILMHKQTANILLRYSIVISKLCDCYDQIVHPQKRLLIRRILDLTIARYLEIKQELVNIDQNEYTYVDDVLIQPDDDYSDISIPSFYRRERINDIKWKYNFIDNVKINTEDEQQQEIIEDELTEEEAIRLIQKHERARQYRMRAQSMKNIRMTGNKKAEEEKSEEIQDEAKNAALKIQRIWRAMVTRRKIKQRVLEEMLLIGMKEPERYCTKEREKSEEIKLQRHEIQQQYQQEYQEMLVIEKDNVRKFKGDMMKEGIKDEVRNWYTSYWQQTGKFPDLPSDETGGSAAIFRKHSPYVFGSEVSKSTGAASTTTVSKASKENKIKETQSDKKKTTGEDEDLLNFSFSPSNVLNDLIIANSEYEEIWKNLDEIDNPEQSYVLDMIRDQKTSELETEFRKAIDGQIRVELEHLREALDRDMKGRKSKKSGKKKARRSGKKAKKKKDKDLTQDRTTESLFEELIENGIIRSFPQTFLSDFKGSISRVSYEYGQSKKDVPPSLGDISQVIRDYCIFPLSSMTIHQSSPLMRSLLIAGPTGCGKKMLVNAICTEIGAVLFDISPGNIAGKYTGKTGLNMLVHLINKVSKLLQPSIIFVNDAEKPFLKKVSKTDKTDPKRMKKDMIKIVKAIGPSDLVMVIGITKSPWECDQKALFQVYNKVIMTIRPDYSSLIEIWTQLIQKYNALNPQLNISILTKLSDGYTIGSIFRVMQQLMTCKRILRLKIQGLTIQEILETLSLHEPVYKEEEEAFMQWYAKSPLGKNRQKVLELEEQLKLEESEMTIKNKKGSK